MKTDKPAKRLIHVPHSTIVRAPGLLHMRYTTNEMAEYLGCSPRSLREWTHIGLPHEQDARKHLWFIGTDVRDWVNNMRQYRLKKTNLSVQDTKSAYCLKCRAKVEIVNPLLVSSGKHNLLKGSCPQCGGTVNRGIKHG